MSSAINDSIITMCGVGASLSELAVKRGCYLAGGGFRDVIEGDGAV